VTPREREHPDRRESPGRRATDFQHTIETNAIDLVKKARRAYAIVAAAAAAVASAFTVLLMLFGLRIGGAADLTTLRTDVARRDSASELQRHRTDSATAANTLRIDRLERSEAVKMFLLCTISERVGAPTGGLCGPITQTPPAQP
jgi:hypothetical protein